VIEAIGAAFAVVLLIGAAGWAVRNLWQQGRDADARITFDAITEALRMYGWQPNRPLACGCTPTALCPGHAEVRWLDSYRAAGGGR